MLHELKIWPKYYVRVFMNEKNFELRKDDRNFDTSDTLYLREFDPDKNDYTGRSCHRGVTYILRGGSFGLEAGYVIMSLNS